MGQKLKLWTIQRKAKWEEFEKTGILIANPEYVDKDFIQPYSWIEKEMSKRIGNSPAGNKHSIWSWYRNNERNKQPDLRRSGYFERGTDSVIIEFEEDSNKILLTDFSDWHIVLNTCGEEEIKNECTSLDMEGLDSSDVKFPWVISGDNMIMKWENIILEPSSTLKYIQATVWQVEIHQVKKVTHFKSK